MDLTGLKGSVLSTYLEPLELGEHIDSPRSVVKRGVIKVGEEKEIIDRQRSLGDACRFGRLHVRGHLEEGKREEG